MSNLSFQFFLLLLINTGFLYSQNLVLNGDFEQVNICSEYNEACSPVAWRSTSEKLFGYNEKSDENKYATLTLYSGGRAEDRKFIQTELICPLIKDEVYTISFMLQGNIYSINSICVGFSGQFQYHDSWLNFADIDKECIAVESLIKNKEWVNVEMEYQAKGGEKFIIIGNLNKDANTSFSISDKKAYKKIRKSYTRQEHIQYKIDNVFIKSLSGEICDDYGLRSNFIVSQRHRHSGEWEIYERPIKEYVPVAIAKEAPQEEVVKDDIEKEEKRKPTLRKIILRDLFFETNSSNLDLADQKDLQELIFEMKQNKKIRISIVGHTDQKGTVDYNLNLSLQRANAVKAFLSQQGIDTARMHTDGRGETELLSEQTDAASLRLNRRVEIVILE